MTDTISFECRMYENKYPEVEDLVTVRVKSIAEMGAYVSLLEYNNVEGMILLSELSRRRIRSISKLIRVGRQEVVVVLRVDKEKGYIDLSKRRVSPEDVAKCEEKYNKSKAVHSIMRHVADCCKIDLEALYTQFGWPLYKRFGHAYEAFKAAIADPSILDEYNITPEIKEHLLKNIERRLKPQDLKLRADIEVTCFCYEGIDAIKAALQAGQDFLQAGSLKADGADKEDRDKDKITMIAPPLYVIETTSPDKEKGIKLLNDAVEVIRAAITKSKGSLVVKVAPRAVSERDDHMLTQYMEELERQNAEVDGDADGSDEDEEDEKDA